MDSQDNYVAQTNTENQVPNAPVTAPIQTPPKKNKSGSAGAIIAILIIVIIALGGTVAFLSINQSRTGDNQNSANASNDNTDTETKITSAAVKKDLHDKIIAILTNGWGIHNEGSVAPMRDHYLINNYDANTKTLFGGKELSEDDKGAIAIRNTAHLEIGSHPNSQDLYNEDKAIAESKGDNFYDYGFYSTTGNYYDKDSVASVYRNIFGKDMTHKTISSSCPTYLYREKYNIYTDFDQCGGGDPTATAIFFDSYTKNDKTAYINMYVGFLQPIKDSNETEYELLSGIDDNATRIKTLPWDFDYDLALITDENKTDFAQYRFVFEGENDDYHFVKVEKVEKK